MTNAMLNGNKYILLNVECLNDKFQALEHLQLFKIIFFKI